MSDFGNALAAAVARNSRLAGYAPPLSVTPPVIDGEGHVGTPMACTTGVWDHVPTGYAYQWKSGGTSVGTNASTYTLVEADAGKAVTCVVSATNATGTTTATSAPVVIAGGGTPAWVPSGAKIHIDFLGGAPQGRAWVDGAGEVAIAPLLPFFDADNLHAGIGFLNGGPQDFAGALLTAVLGSFTGRIQYLWPVGATSQRLDDTFFVQEETGSYALQLTLDFPLGRVRLQGYNEIDLIFNSAPLHTTNGSYNVVAFTLTTVAGGGRAEFAVNGSAATSGAYDLDDRPTANPFTYARTDPRNLAIQSITIYDPLPTAAGLSALSAIP